MKRRNILKSITLLPLAGTLAPIKSVFASSAATNTKYLAGAGELSIGPDIFQSIGIEPIINCRGTFTIIGGSIERMPELV